MTHFVVTTNKLIEEPVRLLIIIKFLFLISSANAYFICSNGFLYNSLSQDYLNFFYPADNCQKAIDNSRNGFICANGYLYNSISIEFLKYFYPNDNCQKAVENSNNGFICANGYLYNSISNKHLKYFYPNEKCLNAIGIKSINSKEETL